MTEPAGSWLDPNVQFSVSDDPASFRDFYTAEQQEVDAVAEPIYAQAVPRNPLPNDPSWELLQAMAQQQALMAEQLKWLCFHVSNILQMAQSNLMVKMMMNKAAKNG